MKKGSKENRGYQRRLIPRPKESYQLLNMSLTGWFGLVMSPICLSGLYMQGGRLLPGHRRLPGWRLWFLVTLLTGSVKASEDHDLLQRFRQARAAEALQQSIQPELDNRWRDFAMLYGLQRPPIDQVHQAAIHRPDSTTPHMPEVAGTTLRYAVEPESIRQDVSNKWPDLRRDDGTISPWKAYQFPDAVYNSAFFANDFKHYILTTLAEDRAHRGEVPMAVEITWFLHDCAHAGLSKRWMKSVMTTVHFLREVGMLQSCNMAYRCDILMNGHVVTTTWLTFSPGDFAEIQARQQPPPDDTESETEMPQPMTRVSSRETSSTTSSASDTPTPGEYFADVAISNAIVIYRPPNLRNRPHQIVTPVTQEDRANLGVATMHWTDLRYNTWTLAPVHPTYEEEYPPGDYVHTFLLVALCDLPSPLHQVILLVVHTPESMLIKAQITMPLFDRVTALLLTRLEHFCNSGTTTCRVYLNGQLLPEGTQRRVTNGDYVRITMSVAPGPRTSALMATEFHVMPQAQGMEYIEETAIDILTGSNSQMIPRNMGQMGSNRSTLHNAYGIQCSEWYWIYLGFYVYVSLIGCLRFYDPPVREQRQKTRHGKNINPRKPVRALLFTMLLLGQHGQGCGLAIMNKGVAPHSSAMWHTASTIERLPPPGNPLYRQHGLPEDTILTRQNLTTKGVMLLDYLAWQTEMRQLQHTIATSWGATGKSVETDEKEPCTVRSTYVGKSSQEAHDLERSQAIGKFQGEEPTVLLPIAASIPDYRSEPMGGGVASQHDKQDNQRYDFSIDADVDVMDDHHGLTRPWVFPTSMPLTSLELDYHPESIAALEEPEEIHSEEYTDIYIYTDGSAGLHDQEYGSSWAFVAFEGPPGPHEAHQVRFLEWAGDHNDFDPLSPTWLGATQRGIRAGESEALMWAFLWILQANDARPVHVASDALSVLNAANGTWGYQDSDTLSLRLRAIYQLLWSIRQGKDIDITHVKGHTGQYGNELADTLAKAVRTGQLTPKKPDVNVAHWFHGTYPSILWAWMPSMERGFKDRDYDNLMKRWSGYILMVQEEMKNFAHYRFKLAATTSAQSRTVVSRRYYVSRRNGMTSMFLDYKKHGMRLTIHVTPTTFASLPDRKLAVGDANYG